MSSVSFIISSESNSSGRLDEMKGDERFKSSRKTLPVWISVFIRDAAVRRAVINYFIHY